MAEEKHVRDKDMPLSKDTWWHSFYKQHQDTRDWYLPCELVLKELFAEDCSLSSCKRLLHLGCGSSDLPFLLHGKGVTTSVNIDFAEPIIEAMGKLATVRNMGTLQFKAMDVRALSFPDSSFDFVLDKGTLDCVVLEKNGKESSHTMLKEIARVLKPGCQCYIFSLYPPDRRLDLLEQPEYGWDVSYRAIDFAPLERPDRDHTHLYILTTKAGVPKESGPTDTSSGLPAAAST